MTNDKIVSLRCLTDREMDAANAELNALTDHLIDSMHKTELSDAAIIIATLRALLEFLMDDNVTDVHAAMERVANTLRLFE